MVFNIYWLHTGKAKCLERGSEILCLSLYAVMFGAQDELPETRPQMELVLKEVIITQRDVLLREQQ